MKEYYLSFNNLTLYNVINGFCYICYDYYSYDGEYYNYITKEVVVHQRSIRIIRNNEKLNLRPNMSLSIVFLEEYNIGSKVFSKNEVLFYYTPYQVNELLKTSEEIILVSSIDKRYANVKIIDSKGTSLYNISIASISVSDNW